MNYHRIFSIVNEHTASTVQARYAISLAAACKAELVLYAVHDEGSNEELLRRTERHLDHLQKISLDLNIPVTRITEIGNIRTMLPARVQLEKADLVCYPLTGDERYGDNFKQHTVHHLLRTIKPDLAIMRVISMGKPHPGHILVPFGEVISGSEHRLAFLTALAVSFKARVTLYHLSAVSGAEEMPGDIIRFRKQLQQHVTVLERTGVGPLGKAITLEAISHHNDLIVLGASERGILRSVFFGNPAGDVMHTPPCNVILFRPHL